MTPSSSARRVRLIALVLALSVAFCADAAPANNPIAPAYSSIFPGLDYAQMNVTNVPWSIHIARIDRSRKDFEIRTTLANGTVQGLSPVTAQAAALESAHLHPVLAVNGNFFVIASGPYQGDPESLEILEGELVSAPLGPCFWLKPPGALQLAEVQSRMAVHWPDGTRTPLGLNEAPRTNTAVLFTPTFGDSTRATNLTELVLEPAGSGPWLPLRQGEIYRAIVREIRWEGNSLLHSNLMILTVGRDCNKHLAGLRPGAALKFTTDFSRNLSGVQFAVGGRPILVQNGLVGQWRPKPDHGTNQLPRHPRTAIGFNQRHLFLVVVDGRQPELSRGMTFPELARFMKQLGCTGALNLDGGGSSTFWLNGQVMNSPSDKHERAVANAVVIMRRE